MIIDPDAPWGWNLFIIIVILGILPLITSWMANRNTKHKLATIASDLSANKLQLENEHTDSDFPNLREEITSIRTSIGGMHSEVRDLRLDVTGIRTDARRDRRDLHELQRTTEEFHAALHHPDKDQLESD